MIRRRIFFYSYLNSDLGDNLELDIIEKNSIDILKNLIIQLISGFQVYA